MPDTYTPPPGEGERAAALEAEKRFALEQERFQRVVRIATPFISVLIALLIGSVVILASGHSPIEAYSAMFYGAFGGVRQIGETLLRATPLIFTGLAVAYGFRSGLFNIGAEGQLFLGGLAAAFVGVKIAGYPWAVSVPVVLLAAMLAGAAWAFIPALMKAKIGAHEVITTMMFTYIGRYLVSWIVTGPFKAEGAIPQTPELPVTSQLPRISDVFPFISQNRAHLGFLLGVVAAIVVWWILRYTVLGFEARAVGFNPFASETGGVSVSATIIKSLCISGLIAGLAGAAEVMGVHYRLFDQFSSGFGFTGIAVALLAKNNPIGVIAAAILFGSLSAGAGTMQLEAGVSQKVISIIQGTIIFLVGAETIVTWAVSKFRRPKGAPMFAEVFTPELFASAVRLATPIALAATGAAICERSGVVNIAMEGLMLMSAFSGVAVALLTGNTWLGVAGAVLGAMLFSSLHAWASINLRSDQVISGTAINILALGVTGFLMESVFGRPGTTDPVKTIPPVLDLPPGGPGLIGTIWTWIDVVFLSYTPIVYFGIFAAIFLTWALYRTRWGLRLRSLGEHPRAADTVGISVLRGRWVAVSVSGFMAGMAGANLTLEQVGSFTEGMTNGRGFIALAAMIFGRWIPGGAYLASLLFGFADALQLKLQLFSDVINIPPQFFLMLPYVLTVVVLAGVVGRAVAPAADGKPYKEKG